MQDITRTICEIQKTSCRILEYPDIREIQKTVCRTREYLEHREIHKTELRTRETIKTAVRFTRQRFLRETKSDQYPLHPEGPTHFVCHPFTNPILTFRLPPEEWDCIVGVRVSRQGWGVGEGGETQGRLCLLLITPRVSWQNKSCFSCSLIV